MIPRRPISILSTIFFQIFLLYDCVSISSAPLVSIKQSMKQSLDKKLEDLLLKLLKYNSTPNMQEPIRQFLINYKLMSDNFWERYRRSNSFEEVLECYYQYSKNQCTIVETLLANLRFTLDKDNTREELATMLKDGFTF